MRLPLSWMRPKLLTHHCDWALLGWSQSLPLFPLPTSTEAAVSGLGTAVLQQTLPPTLAKFQLNRHTLGLT